MAQSTPPEPATGLTAELVVSTWHPSDVRLSPDGCRVAWSATPYGRSEKHGERALGRFDRRLGAGATVDLQRRRQSEEWRSGKALATVATLMDMYRV